MRNLKKLLAVIVSVCVLATFALPAFAAETALTDAEICEDLGVVKGEGAGLTDDYLAKGTTRLQAAIMYLRMLKLEDAAKAYTGEENFDDAADVAWAEGKAILGYLKANPDLGWAGVGGNKFDPYGPASAQMMYKVALEALGYKQDAEDGFKWADVFTFAADKGLGKVADVTELTNDDMCTVVVEMLGIKVKGGDKTLIEKLIDDGVIAEADAIEVGLIAAVPAELEVDSVTATNLIQAVVTFNQKVDKDTANDKDNYDFATADKITVADAALSDDGVSVVLTFAAKVDQQKTAKLTVSGVKTAAGAAMTKSTTEVSFLDSTIPEIVSAEVAGISTIKVTFSEPMDKSSIETVSYYKVNDGKYYVKKATAQKNDTEVLVELYTSLKDGDLPFEVKVGPKDYAGFTAMGLTTTLTVVEDKEAPTVVSYKDAKPNSVVLIWNEDIVLANGAKANFYHTNSSNTIENPLTSAEIDGNEMTLNFAKANKLPNGTAYAYVLKDAVKDLWNNKNAQQMTAIDVVVDKDPPVLQSIDFKNEKQIVAVFDEVVAKANVKANYTILDKDGKEVKNIISSFDITTAKKVTINFTKNLDGGDYTLVVKDVEDVAGNAMSSTSMGFTVTDKTVPDPTKFTAKLYIVAGTVDQVLKVSFGEAMAVEGAYSIDDLAKYVFKASGKAIKDIDDVTIAVVDDGKAVEITIPNTKFVVPSTGSADLTMARVADAAGNYTVAMQYDVDIDPSGTVSVSKAELTGEKEVKIYFSDELAKFEATEILFTPANVVSTVTTDLKDGKTVATYTLSDALNYDATGLTIKTANPGGANVTANGYGETLVKDATVATYNDKLAPAIAKTTVGTSTDKVDNVVTVDSDNNGILESIKITYTEDLLDDVLNKYSYAVSGHKVTGVTEASGVVTIALDTAKDDNGDDLVAAWDQEPTVTQLLSIYDAAGNEKAADSEAIASIDKQAPVANTATENADATVITITFTEELDAATVVAANFTGTAGAPTVSYIAGSRTVTLTYAAALVDTNTIIVGAGIKDANGNAITEATFTRDAEAAGAGVYAKS